MRCLSNSLILSIVGTSLLLSTAMCGSDDSTRGSSPLAASSEGLAGFPQYDHVFLIINENHNAKQILGNPAAPIINALATDYGLATSYTGVGDPSEPNYVAMLGGSTFGINSDDP